MRESTNFTNLLVRNRVKNFEQWRDGFESHASHRIAAGLQERFILRNSDNPNDFFVLFDTDNPQETSAFIHSASLSEFKGSLGLTAAPEYIFLQQVPLVDHAVHKSTVALIEQAFREVDAMDATAFGEFFSEDALFQFANMPPAKGPKAITEFVQNFFSTIKSISHHLHQSLAKDDMASVSGTVEYGRKDGTKITLPFSNTFRIGLDEKFEHWQIYMDTAPLYLPV